MMNGKTSTSPIPPPPLLVPSKSNPISSSNSSSQHQLSTSSSPSTSTNPSPPSSLNTNNSSSTGSNSSSGNNHCNNSNNNTSTTNLNSSNSNNSTPLNSSNSNNSTTTNSAPTPLHSSGSGNNTSSSNIATSVEKKSWTLDFMSRRSSTSLPTNPMTRMLNKLHQAVAAKDLAEVKKRLSHNRKAKIELLEFDHMDHTPLCAALRNGSYDIVKEILKFYTDNKIDINQQYKNGYSALHVAAMSCSDDQVLMLLLNYEGINVNLLNDDQNSPLHYFCQCFKSPNCQEPFQLFLKKGVNVNSKNRNGESVLHKATINNIVRLLMVDMLLKAGAEVNVINSRGESPLHFAVRLGREDLVTVLVKAGADITIRGNERKTCYELALQGHNIKVTNFLKNVQDVYDWLKSIELEKYWLNFVKEEIFMDLLPDIDEKTLDSLDIKSSGHRLKIIKNCRILKENPSYYQSLLQQNQHQPQSGMNNIEQNRKLTTMESLKSNNSVDSTGSISSDDLKESIGNLEHWVIDHSDLEYTLKLGSGSSGKVYKGIYKGKEVAVKVLKSITTQSQLEEFKKEFQIMGSIRSQFMVTFYGACIEPKLCMVMEYCSRDSLYHVMNTKKYDIGWDRFFQFTMQMTLGIQCLHNWSPQIVHRDFKSLNLLVNEDWECKVSDFGLSRFNTADNLETLGKIRGTFAYCSPEVANGSGSLYTTKSDVYSIGIVFWELIVRVMTGEYSRPYSEYPHIKMDFQIMLNSKEGLRPTLPLDTPVGLVNLFKQCVHQFSDKRPSCEEIIVSLNQLRQEYLQNKEKWDSLIVKPPSSSNPTTTTSNTSTGNLSNLSSSPSITSSSMGSSSISSMSSIPKSSNNNNNNRK
ncbi:ankyrin repeat-containing protein [Tieghemostelium lacteum]|uniref:non-specific serine/threonine protein kinase n=1 Tax=Tieghemostelium lacteum TaxID=361077 RepID=A0A151ZAG7_TIELA|nr:ankyrin repeat-containing protein [Tieghemostelium lacteum]|eukprot:KYQ90942.1 ankyrin repeat-containing protein [Tieghemostelium lacteum]